MDARPPYFYLKKYVIMGFTIVQVILLIIFIALIGVGMSSAHNSSISEGLGTSLIVTFTIAIIIQILGFFGAWKEHFCLICFYSILSAIAFCLSIFNSIHSGWAYWVQTVILFLVTIDAILFTIDLRRMRLSGQQSRQPATF